MGQSIKSVTSRRWNTDPFSNEFVEQAKTRLADADGKMYISPYVRLHGDRLNSLPVFECATPDDGIFYVVMPKSTLSAKFNVMPHHWVCVIRWNHGELIWPPGVYMEDNVVKAEIGYNPISSPARYQALVPPSLVIEFGKRVNLFNYVATSPLTPFIYSYVNENMPGPLGRFGRGLAKMSREDIMVQRLAQGHADHTLRK